MVRGLKNCRNFLWALNLWPKKVKKGYGWADDFYQAKCRFCAPIECFSVNIAAI